MNQEATTPSLALAQSIIRILDRKKARKIRLLHVEEQTVMTDYLVICEGTSRTQLRSLAGEVEFVLGEEGTHPLHVDGSGDATWIVLDYAHVMVHIFSREQREYYNLEKLWHDAVELDISDLLLPEGNPLDSNLQSIPAFTSAEEEME